MSLLLKNSQAISREELANSFTHGVGFILSIIGTIFLFNSIAPKEDVWTFAAISIYGSSLVVLYGTSTCYHFFQEKNLKFRLKILDHCAIYFLIAGTYTPFTLLALEGPLGKSLLYAIWTLAFGGIIFKLFFIGRFKVLSVIIYLLMGWLVILAIEPLINSISLDGFYWVAGGGLFYSLGVIFYALKKIRFHHAIWHLFVLSGSICHYYAVLFYIIP